jgi:hypothetical protein
VPLSLPQACKAPVRSSPPAWTGALAVPAHGMCLGCRYATLRPTLSCGGREAQVGLSFSDGLEIDRNTSRRLLQRLRQSLRWEEAPVITGFDPRYNQSQPLWCAPRRRALKPPL